MSEFFELLHWRQNFDKCLKKRKRFAKNLLNFFIIDMIASIYHVKCEYMAASMMTCMVYNMAERMASDVQHGRVHSVHGYGAVDGR